MLRPIVFCLGLLLDVGCKGLGPSAVLKPLPDSQRGIPIVLSFYTAPSAASPFGAFEVTDKIAAVTRRAFVNAGYQLTTEQDIDALHIQVSIRADYRLSPSGRSIAPELERLEMVATVLHNGEVLNQPLLASEEFTITSPSDDRFVRLAWSLVNQVTESPKIMATAVGTSSSAEQNREHQEVLVEMRRLHPGAASHVRVSKYKLD